MGSLSERKETCWRHVCPSWRRILERESSLLRPVLELRERVRDSCCSNIDPYKYGFLLFSFNDGAIGKEYEGQVT